MKTSEILNKSADAIQERGWIRGGTDPWGGGAGSTAPVCLEGGILAAMGLSTNKSGLPPLEFAHCPAYRSVQDYLYPDPGERTNPFFYNDAPGRTAEEVIGVLRACAVIEEAREEALEKVAVPA